jgi:NADH dehydrogenase
MQARVFVTGASGFVGSAVVDELLARRHPVHALLNRRPVTENARTFRGDLFDNAVLDEAMRGCDAVIHLVGIIMEHPSKGITFQRIHFDGAKNVIDAAVRNGIKRFIHMSALGVRPDAVSDYHTTKYRAEEYLRATGLDWTIFRPSMIHGPRGEFMQMAAKWSRMQAPPFLFMPYFGAGFLGFGGAGMLQPVYVNDVARAFVDALENPRTIGEAYLLGGTEQLTWPELHRTISQAIVGRKRWTFPLPVWKAKLLAAIGLGKVAGFNRDQIIMSQEDNTCDLTKFEQDFGWTPRGFEESLKSYAALL